VSQEDSSPDQLPLMMVETCRFFKNFSFLAKGIVHNTLFKVKLNLGGGYI
jgi:hypothetical protein